jgi:glycosyltransferase involved in cell wall biosynthesis
VNVLYVVTAYPRERGDVITPWLSETIRRLKARGVGVEVLAPAYRGLGDQVVEGVKVHRFRYAPAAWETLTHDQTAPDRVRDRPAFLGLVPGYVLAGSLAAARLARSGRFDVVHAFWPIPQGILGLAARRAGGIPLVSTFFGVELTWVERQLKPLRPLLRTIAARSDAVTVISTYTAELLRRAAPAVAPEVIPFGAAVDPSYLPRSPASAAAVPFTVLFVGRLVERKGVAVLLRAVARLRSEGREIRVRILGDGPELAALEALSEDLGMSGTIEFGGFVSPEALQSAYGSADLFVLPAVVDRKGDVEGLGVVLIEALLAGTPVIGSRAGGIPDVVRDGETGWLVPPGDAEALAGAIAAAMDDPAEARRRAAAGRIDVSRRFSWEGVVGRLETVYRRLAPEAA